MTTRYAPRDLAYAGLFGAAALLLPVLFHLIHLGHVFMPMYLPLVVLAFLVRPLPAALSAAITPLLSAAVTGMPPFYPPIALFMAVELAAMATFIARICARWPRANAWLVLATALVLGRIIYIGLVYGFAQVIAVPAGLLAWASFVSGWPGMVLMLATVPAIVRIVRRSARLPLAPSEEAPS
jgi:hypothetical protein